MRTIAALALLVAASACDKPAPAPASSASAASSSAPSVTASASASATAAAASASASAAASSTASAAASASAAPSASASAAPLPTVKIANIGMHIGGGPNDALTKEPIAKSVEPHFDEFRRCFAMVDDPKRGGDFGVDILIEADGGKAKVTGPRTKMKGTGFEDCVVKVFAGIDFLKPRHGKTMVSYSLQFSP